MDGCVAYTFAVDVVDPNVVRMSESRRDQQSLETHLAGDEFQGVRKELADSSSSSGAFNDMASRQ
jgi:quinol monooxygenase YgiN